MIEEPAYWIALAPYGNKFGNKGEFLIKFGECEIDNQFVFGKIF